jgi:hypothetical protein
MAKGYAVSIGLNSVDPKHYQGWAGDLLACEADATDMADIVTAARYADVKTLLGAGATREAVRAAIERAVRDLRAGDLLTLTYSGHGGQLPDEKRDEPDRQHETWCLHDAELLDDELYDLFAAFEAGVRVFVVSDTCHSGTMTRAVLRDAAERSGTLLPLATREGGSFVIDLTVPRYRAMPDEVAQATYHRNRDFYDRVLGDVPPERRSRARLRASVRLVSACQDNQLSRDGIFNGLFTGTLLRVWKKGDFGGDYAHFHQEIVRLMPSDQTPNHRTIGPPDPQYDARTPFAV